MCHASSSAIDPPGCAVSKIAKPPPRTSLRLGLPSKGRMAEDTMDLLKVGAPRSGTARVRHAHHWVWISTSCCCTDAHKQAVSGTLTEDAHAAVVMGVLDA